MISTAEPQWIEVNNHALDYFGGVPTIVVCDNCKQAVTGNKNWIEGIIAHATYKISSGKIEGINQKIKTLRRQGYGYPDDEYFFLKIMDMSRKKYVRNQSSHRISD